MLQVRGAMAEGKKGQGEVAPSTGKENGRGGKRKGIEDMKLKK